MGSPISSLRGAAVPMRSCWRLTPRAWRVTAAYARGNGIHVCMWIPDISGLQSREHRADRLTCASGSVFQSPNPSPAAGGGLSRSRLSFALRPESFSSCNQPSCLPRPVICEGCGLPTKLPTTNSNGRACPLALMAQALPSKTRSR